MPEVEKEDNGKDNQEKKTKKKKSSKPAEGKEKVQEQVTSNPQETTEKELTEDKEQPKVETVGAENAKEVSTKKKDILDSVPLFQDIKIRDEVGKEDMTKLLELREAFSLFDVNRDGVIDLDDLKFTFSAMGDTDIPEEQLKKMLEEMPSPIDFDAFVSVFGRKVTIMDPEEIFTAALSTWDLRDTGSIPEEKIRTALLNFGDKFTLKDLDRALEEAPVFLKDGNSLIDYIRFSSNICGFRNLIKAREHQKKSEDA